MPRVCSNPTIPGASHTFLLHPVVGPTFCHLLPPSSSVSPAAIGRSPPLTSRVRHYADHLFQEIMQASMEATTNAVWKACCEIVGNEGAAMDENASFFELGIDSLGLAELVLQLELVLKLEEGAIEIDDVLANPSVSELAAKLCGSAVLKDAPTKLTLPVGASDVTSDHPSTGESPRLSPTAYHQAIPYPSLPLPLPLPLTLTPTLTLTRTRTLPLPLPPTPTPSPNP